MHSGFRQNDGKRCGRAACPILGGSSSINGQVYCRGHHRDYDEWCQLGNEGWDWESVKPYFVKAERWNGRKGELRGTGGPLRTAFGRYKMELFDAFVAAGQQAGYPYNADYNGKEQEGFVYTQYTHTHHFPMRCSRPAPISLPIS